MQKRNTLTREFKLGELGALRRVFLRDITSDPLGALLNSGCGDLAEKAITARAIAPRPFGWLREHVSLKSYRTPEINAAVSHPPLALVNGGKIVGDIEIQWPVTGRPLGNLGGV